MLKPPSGVGSEPYCGQCGYILSGLADSSRCPECGRPIVEVLSRRTWSPSFGKRYRSSATLFGLPVIDIALGPKDGELRGKARGWIAIGDMAIGVLAIGPLAVGVVAIGGLSLGLFSLAGCAIGLICSLGGASIGGLAVGGGALGLLAAGGGAIGLFAQGGGATGRFVRSAEQLLSPSPPQFDAFSWFFGPWPPQALTFARPVLVVAALIATTTALIGLIAGWAMVRDGKGKLHGDLHRSR